MTPEEAKARVAEQAAKLHDLEAEVARRASSEFQATAVMLAMLRALVEMVCASSGSAFAVHYKLKFYEGVLHMLDEKGIT